MDKYAAHRLNVTYLVVKLLALNSHCVFGEMNIMF